MYLGPLPSRAAGERVAVRRGGKARRGLPCSPPQLGLRRATGGGAREVRLGRASLAAPRG